MGVELEKFQEKKLLIHRLTDEEIETDFAGIFKATEEKFQEDERKAKEGQLLNPTAQLDFAKFFTSEATRDPNLFLKIKRHTVRRTSNDEKLRVVKALA